MGKRWQGDFGLQVRVSCSPYCMRAEQNATVVSMLAGKFDRSRMNLMISVTSRSAGSRNSNLSMTSPSCGLALRLGKALCLLSRQLTEEYNAVGLSGIQQQYPLASTGRLVITICIRLHVAVLISRLLTM